MNSRMRTVLYRTWTGMRRRCEDPADKGYHNYGGRGIRVCERWRESFDAFAEDMGPRPEGMSIDRINNDGNYEPGNCRWADRKTQNGNTRYRQMVASVARLIEPPPGIDPDALARLSVCEMEVISMYGQGIGPSEVALRTGKSVKTVTTFAMRAAKKLGLPNSKQLHRFAVTLAAMQSASTRSAA